MTSLNKKPAGQRGTVSPRESSLSLRRALMARDNEITAAIASPKIYAVIYCRVSEQHSAENNLSIPDQERQCRKLAADEGWEVLKVYKEPGRSAKSTNGRPAFLKMMDDAFDNDRPFQKIVIHSTSRFARNQGDFIVHTKALFDAGIDVVSLTQRFQKDTGGFIAQSATVMFDEYHSQRTSIDVSRTMTAMAKEGYCPGGRLPFGYTTKVAEDNKKRKTIVIDELEREVARKIFELAIYGSDGTPLGVKQISKWLTTHGYRTRGGSLFSANNLHNTLTNPIYMGVKIYNENAKEQRWSPRPSERVEIPVPAIVSKEEFAKLQTMLQMKNPRNGTAKVFSSPMLLSGLAVCKCGAGMTLRTGTSQTGLVYRYYQCGKVVRYGKFLCSGPSIPEKMLDNFVIEAVLGQVLQVDRLIDLLNKLNERFVSEQRANSGKLNDLQARLATAEREFKNLLMIAKHSIDLGSQPIILTQLTELEQEVGRTRNAINKIVQRPSQSGEITEAKVAHFSNSLAAALRDPDRVRMKSYLRAIVMRVVVGERFVRIMGALADLERGVDASNEAPSGDSTEVRNYRLEWCAIFIRLLVHKTVW